MANIYLDSNGTVAGFGTLTQSLQTGNSLTGSGNSNGLAVVTPLYFSEANANVLNLGSLSTSSNTLPGTISITGNTRAINVSGLVFQNMPAGNTNNQTITNIGFPLGSVVFVGTNPFCQVTAAGKLVLDTLVSGTINWEKRGASTLQLLKDNDFSGGMTIAAGTVEIGNASALGTGTVTMTGGELSSSSTTGYTLANALTLNGTMTLGDVTNTGLLTFSGATTISGPTTLTIPANYVLIQGVFGGTGSFNLTSGELDLEGATGTKSGGTTVSGGTLYLGFGKTASDQLGTDSLTIDSGQAFFCGSGNTTIASVITGTGGYLYARPRNATITFSGADAYAGVARIFAGASDGAGTTTQGMTFSSASFPAVSDFTFINQNSAAASNTQTIKYTGSATSITSTASISIVPTVATTSVWHHAPSNGSGTMSLSGAVASDTTVAHTFRITNDSSGLLSFTNGIDQRNTGVLTLVKTGTGPATVSAGGTYLGSVSVSTGTLNANSATALGAASSIAGITVASGATLSLGAAVNYSSPGRTTSISGTGVSGVDAGCLVLADAGPLNLGAINATNNTYIRGTTNTSLTSAIAWSGTGGLRLGAATGTTATFSGAISVSSGTLVAILFGRSNNPDLGTVVLATSNTFAAPAQIDFGTLRISADANLGTAPGVATAAYIIVGGSATLATTATFTLNSNRGIALGPSSGSGTGTIDVASATTLTYAGIIANYSAGTGKLVKSSTGTLKLTGTNTYTGGTDIGGTGTVQAGAVQALGSTGTVTLTTSTATLQTLTTGGQNGKLTVASLNNSAGGTIKIGG